MMPHAPVGDPFGSLPFVISLEQRLHKIGRAIGIGLVCLGLIVLLGWQINNDTLVRLATSGPRMLPITALSMLLCGSALFSLSRRMPTHTPSRALTIIGCSGIVFIIALLSILEHVTNQQTVSHLLFFTTVQELMPNAEFPGRVSMPICIGLILVSLGLLAFNWDNPWAIGFGQLCAVLSALNALRVLLGYMFDTAQVFQVTANTGMALHTAIGFLALSVGMCMINLRNWPANLVLSPYAGGQTVRWVFPAVVIIPLVAAFISAWDARFNLLGLGFEPTLLIGLNVLTLWFLATRIEHNAQLRQSADMARLKSEEQLRLLLHQVPCVVWVTDPQMKITSVFGSAIPEHVQHASIGRSIEEALGDNQGREGVLAHQEALDGRSATYERLIGAATFAVRTEPLRNYSGELIGCLGIAIDITDRKRIEEEIRDLNATLEERVARRTSELELANQELESFSYSVSHDLRAPLRSIDGFSLVLLEDYADRLDAEGIDYLNRVRAATQRMGTLISSMLDLSRVSRVELQLISVDLSLLAQSIRSELQQRDPERITPITIEEGMTCLGDPHLLDIVLRNLIENAWKFTAKSPQATISIRVDDSSDPATLCIHDTGVGFDMAYANKLFRPFQRLHHANDFMGTGVGLATVQRIVHRHGGRIWAESYPDRGTTFAFTLPTLAVDSPHINTTSSESL